MPTTIRALLTDLDGVLRDWSGQDDAAIERAHGLPPGTIKGATFHPDLVGPVITGRVTDATWRRQATEWLREQYPDADVDAAMATWSASAGAVDQAVLDLVREARRRVPVMLITNATDRLPTDLTALGILDAFDHIVNSSVVGAAKPDPVIYLHALDTLGVPGEDVFYMDDQARYLDAARSLGIVAHHYQDVATLRAALADHGLLW